MIKSSVAVALIALAACATAPKVYTGPAGPETTLFILSARGVDLKPGDLLDGAKLLKLATGQRVSLISNAGRGLTLSGPYEASPAFDLGDNDGFASLRAFIAPKPHPLSASYPANFHSPAPDPWVIDVSPFSNGDRCVLTEAEHIDFWLATPSKTGGGVARSVDRTWRTKLDWPQGATHLLIPATLLDVAKGPTFVIDLDGATTAITLHFIPKTASNDAMRAAWMLAKGCEDQARLLIKTLLSANS